MRPYGKGLVRFIPREGWSRITPPGMTSSKGMDVLPSNPNDIVAVGDYAYPDNEQRSGWGILRSRDGGKTWMQVLFTSFGGNDRVKGENHGDGIMGQRFRRTVWYSTRIIQTAFI
jgi:hypothetical protein